MENKKKFYIKIKNLELDLSKAKYLLIRQNPPFNLEYINSTLYLEKLSSQTKIINNPISIRNISEKFYSSKFFRYMPATIFTKDINKISKFYRKYKQLVIKPINGYAGKDIMFINKNFNKLNLVIIEFHNLKKNLKKIKDFINKSKLRNIHINANNYGMVDNKGIPQVIEMTLINPKKFKIKKQKTTRNYPIKGLDYKNRKRGPEIKISFKK